MAFETSSAEKADREMAPGFVRHNKALAAIAAGIGVEKRSYTVSSLPAAADHNGALVHCSDGDAGSPCLAYSDGTDWLRISFGAAVAIT